MKRCPTCQRTYPDDAQNFCLEDGTTLISSGSGNPYDQRSAPTEVLYPAKPTAPPTPPRPAVGAPPPPPGAAPFGSYAPAKKKSPLPWILGGGGVLVAAVIAVILMTSNSGGKTENKNKIDVNVNTPSTPTTTPTVASNWKLFEGDKFSVSMPGTPTKTENQQPTAAGTVPIIMHTLDKGSEGFVVGYTEYPSGSFSSLDPEKLLDGARDGGVGNVSGKVINERPINIGGHKGREITGTSPQGFGFTIRLYLADPRLYMLIYLRRGTETISDDGQKFLDSFDITGD